MRGLAAAALVVAGCHGMTFHRSTNAPGIVDLERAPTDHTHKTVEPPDDPGENHLVVSGGPMGGGSLVLAGPDGGASGHGVLGVEFSLHRGWSNRSHWGDDFWVYPRWAWGVNLGWRFVDDGWDTGPIWLELQRTDLPGSWAVGVVADPAGDDRGVGLQGTAAYAGYYVRASAMLERGVELELGFCLKIPAVWVWSR